MTCMFTGDGAFIEECFFFFKFIFIRSLCRACWSSSNVTETVIPLSTIEELQRASWEISMMASLEAAPVKKCHYAQKP